MDKPIAAPAVGTYADPWRQGRYCVRLSVELASDLHDLDIVLEQLGYRTVDMDQGGRSYHQTGNSGGTAELDELEYDLGPVRLTLGRGDLDEADTAAAQEELTFLFEKVCEALKMYGAESLLFGRRRMDTLVPRAPCGPHEGLARARVGP